MDPVAVESRDASSLEMVFQRNGDSGYAVLSVRLWVNNEISTWLRSAVLPVTGREEAEGMELVEG